MPTEEEIKRGLNPVEGIRRSSRAAGKRFMDMLRPRGKKPVEDSSGGTPKKRYREVDPKDVVNPWR